MPHFGAGIASRALKRQLDIHSSIIWEKLLVDGVDAHFIGRKAIDTVISKVRPSDYWKTTSLTGTPAGYVISKTDEDLVSLYTKQSFEYAIVTINTILPLLATMPLGSNIFWGLEGGAATGTGFILFHMARSGAGVTSFRARLGGNFRTAAALDISGSLPSNYDTVAHRYTIELTRRMAVFYIDDDVVAYGLITPDSQITAITGPPYGVFSTHHSVGRRQNAMVEVWGNGTELRLALSPFRFRVASSDPLPPRVIQLYEAATDDLISDVTLTEGSVTSQPFPVYGFEGKTIWFRANQNGSLVIQLLTQTNEWRTYDTMTTTADTFEEYHFQREATLARIVYTPDAYNCIIAEAEIVLR